MPSHNSPTNPSNGSIESWEAFARWAVEGIGCELEQVEGEFHLSERAADDADHVLNEPARGRKRSWSGFRSRKKSAARSNSAATAEATPQNPETSPAKTFPTSEALAADLLVQLTQQPITPVARPLGQPEAVHEIATRLFGAYTIDGGKVHLSGCHLEDIPFYRYTRLTETGVQHCFGQQNGEIASPELVQQLGLDRVTTPADVHEKSPEQRWQEEAHQSPCPEKSRLTAIVLAKHITGRLQFTLGEATAAVNFSDWARTVAAPAFVCPLTETETFHLSTLDDGSIAAAEAIGVCQVTGVKLLQRDMATCSATGKLVAKTCCKECPITGEPTLEEGMVICRCCGQKISKPAFRGDVCQVCDSPERAARDHETLSKILERYPRLQRLRRYCVGETRDVVIFQASRLLHRWSVTLDRQTFEPLQVSVCGRIGAKWRKVPTTEWPAILGEK